MSNPIADAQALETEGKLAEAIQAYDSILSTTDDTSTLALANFSIGDNLSDVARTFHGATIFVESTSTRTKRCRHPRGN